MGKHNTQQQNDPRKQQDNTRPGIIPPDPRKERQKNGAPLGECEDEDDARFGERQDDEGDELEGDPLDR